MFLSGAFSVVLVAAGSAFGSMARHWISGVVARKGGETFPFGTLVVNISGSFVIGVLFAQWGQLSFDGVWMAFLTYGFLGGYTTYSSFSLQTLNLLRDGEWLHGAMNILVSILTCLLAVFLGWKLGGVIY